MQNDFKKYIHEQLGKLPEVEPDPAFSLQLKKQLEEQPQPKKLRVGAKPWRIAAVAAGLLLTLLIGSLLSLPGEKSQNRLGPVLLASSAGGSAGLWYGGSVDLFRKVTFEVQENLPVINPETKVVKLSSAKLTKQEVWQLAQQMGIAGAEIKPAFNEMEKDLVQVEGTNGQLLVKLKQGSWSFINSEPDTTGPAITMPEAKQAAINWLNKLQRMPQNDYEINIKEIVGGDFEVVVSADYREKQLEIIGLRPEIRVIVSSLGQVRQAEWLWYEAEDWQTVPLYNLQEALQSLQRGEGQFESSGYRSSAPGTARIKQVDIRYQLAYTMDFTPYYIPMGVFQGDYTPDGGTPTSFTAALALVKINTKPNLGNFILGTKLPSAQPSVQQLSRRSYSGEEIAMIARFFGINQGLNAQGVYRSSQGELSVNQDQGGWIFRSSAIGSTSGNKPLEEQQAIQAASRFIAQVPLIPDSLGKAEIKNYSNYGDQWVIYPILYQDKAVIGLGLTGYESYVGVHIGPEGEIWQVVCARPLQIVPETTSLIAPQDAWEKLQENEALIYFNEYELQGILPGDRFAAAQSRITEVNLVYLPGPELANKQAVGIYYAFTGVAQIGEAQVNFTALVKAEKI